MDKFEPWPLGLHPIPAGEAAQAFRASGAADPLGLASPESVAYAGRCFRLTVPHGSAVLSIGQASGALWCYGLAGQGRDMVRAADAVLIRLARLSGFDRIGFHTARPGLVRRCRALGYTVTAPAGAGLQLMKALNV